jgi:hypothetical protein
MKLSIGASKPGHVIEIPGLLTPSLCFSLPRKLQKIPQKFKWRAGVLNL